MSVIVYGRPGCIQCEYTRKWFDKLGVEHTYINVSSDHEAASYVRDSAQSPTLPFVEVGDDISWSGFKLDLIRELAKQTD